MTEPIGSAEAQRGIAIVGMAGRFPGARTLDEFWQNLRAGVESICFFTDEELRAAGVPEELLRNPNYVKARGTLADVDQFDAAFFGFNPREADVTDPQHRLFLECAWEALEHAGYDPGTMAGAVGVFAGASQNTYAGNLMSHPDLQAAVGPFQLMVGNFPDYMTSRVAYKLNLLGPGVTVQTACSTSLVAVALACDSLLHYQCDVALAGGSSVSAPQVGGYLYEPSGINSPDGHCRSFDASAQGTVWGSGVGLVVLKRLADALADGDTIHAVVKGAALNNDGAAKIGFTAPSVEGQAEVIATAQSLAEVTPDTITYIEAHGTATPLGDPIEVAALTAAFRTGTSRSQFCALGSVKSNVGHLDTAAGVAGLIKAVLALQHAEIPPSLHYQQPNPEIDFASSPFYVNATLAPWPAGPTPRRAGVSSFGIGGTNAHVVLEEAPATASSDPAEEQQLLVLSAKTPEALEEATTRLAVWLGAHTHANLADVAYTLQAGRAGFAHRRALVARDAADAAAALAARDPTRLRDGVAQSDERPVAFLFPGQGAQYVGMARDLYAQEPAFREALEHCATLLRPHLGRDLLEALYPPNDRAAQAATELAETALAQPALFAVEYAMARLWQSWGVQPAALLGHSLGEYVAACLAGMLTLEEALTLVAERGRLMQQAPRGAMLAAPLAEEALAPLLGEDLALAAVNGPALSVVSGPEQRIDALRQHLAAQGVETTRLHTSHAFHSPLMEPIVPSFRAAAATVRWQPPTMPLVTNLSGSWADETMADPAYWTEHLRRPVRFAAGLDALLADPRRVLLEVGPGTTLGRLARSHPRFAAGHVVAASARHPKEGKTDRAVLLDALARLWLVGVPIDWPAVHAGRRRCRLPLPTYPFQRQRHWVDPLPAAAILPRFAAPRRYEDPARWTYIPSWRRSDPPALLDAAQLAAEPASWLIFGSEEGVAARLVRRLERTGHAVVTVLAGRQFARRGDRCYELDPARPEDYAALLAAVAARQQEPTRLIHLWSLAGAAGDWASLDRAAEAQERSFYSLLFLAQALGSRQAAPTALHVVTDQAQAVSGDERLRPSGAMALGPCRVIAREYPTIACHGIDIVAPTAGSAAEERLVDQLLTELRCPSAAGLVAFRGGHRWVPAVEPIRLDGRDEAPPPLRERGVYLITGGLGGIGFTLAEELARSVRARLVLVGRSALPERGQWEGWLAAHPEEDETSRRIRRVLTLEALGADVLLARADVTDFDAVTAVVRQTRERFGDLHGVIHAAGLPGGGIIQLKTRAAAEAVLEPKVRGTLVLHAALRDAPLDFLMLCSSISAILGPMGQVDYCAANAFLDAYAHAAAAQQGRRVVAVNWDAWRDVGMAVDAAVPAAMRAAREHELREGIAPAEGVVLFRRILQTSLPQVIASTRDLRALLEDAASDDAPATAAGETSPAPAQHARPALLTAYAPARTAVEQLIVDLWRELLGVERVGIHDDFFELGGHSLLAIQFLSRLRSTLQVDLPMRAIFDAPTAAELAASVEAATPAVADDGIADALERIEQLSDDEVKQLLSQVDRSS